MSMAGKAEMSGDGIITAVVGAHVTGMATGRIGAGSW